jgi:beta-glucanase (GH16 family)
MHEEPIARNGARHRSGVAALVLSVIAACGADLPASPDASWQLTWSDEFDAADGSAPAAARWVYDTGGGGWGNNELQTYTDRRDNAVIRDGTLVITALKERFTGADGITRDYTSARLKTSGTFAQTYGRFESRMKLPRGQGLWPAFWMLGDNVGSAGWPTCGEIDIMENIGREPSIVHGTLHGPGYSGAQGPSAGFTNPSGRPFADDFHVFAIEWEPSAIRWYVDGTLAVTRTPSDLPGGARWVFDHPFFLLVNVAVGGVWPGNPDATTSFPQELVVDWLRVYRR